MMYTVHHNNCDYKSLTRTELAGEWREREREREREMQGCKFKSKRLFMSNLTADERKGR